MEKIIDNEKMIYDPFLLSYEQINNLTTGEILNILSTLANEFINIQNNTKASNEDKMMLKNFRNDPDYKDYVYRINNNIEFINKELKSNKVGSIGINKKARLFIASLKKIKELDEDNKLTRSVVLKILKYFEDIKRTA